MSLQEATFEQTDISFALAFTTDRKTRFPQEEKQIHLKQTLLNYAKKQSNDHAFARLIFISYVIFGKLGHSVF